MKQNSKVFFHKYPIIVFGLIIFLLIPGFVFAKYCIYCGSKNPDEANFCIQCGKKFPEASIDKIKPPRIKELKISNSEFQRLQKRSQGIITFPYFTFKKSGNSFVISKIIDSENKIDPILKEGDLITEVSGNPIIDYDISGLDFLLSKSPGEKINLTLFRASENKKYNLALTCKQSEFTGIIPISTKGNIPSYYLSAINEKTPAHFSKILSEANKNNCERIIFDLRSCLNYPNLKPALEMLKYLLPEGEKIGYQVNFDDTKETFISDKTFLSYIPITLIVDETVEGVAEWFAGSLQYNQRATLVGTNTGGKPFLSGWKKIDEKYQLFIKAILLLPDEKPFSSCTPDIPIPSSIPPDQWMDWYLSKIKKDK